MDTFFLTIFWMICILWATYYWYWSSNKIDNSKPQVVFDFNRRHSTSSTESLQHSGNEGRRKKEYNLKMEKNMRKLKHEIKTRWPSETSIKKKSYRSF